MLKEAMASWQYCEFLMDSKCMRIKMVNGSG